MSSRFRAQVADARTRVLKFKGERRAVRNYNSGLRFNSSDLTQLDESNMQADKQSATNLPASSLIKAPMEWSTTHDVLLCREMLAVNPFSAKRKTTQRAKMWETVANNLEDIDTPKFKVTVRSVRDRYSLLAKKYRKQMQSEKKASGISPEVSKLDVLLEELIALEDLSEGEKENENEEKNKKAEQDRAKAVDIRKKLAMEKLSDTQKRKSQEGDESSGAKKKFRRSSGDTVAYLKERNDVEFELRKEELEFKKKKHEDDMKKQEVAAKRQDDMINLMVQQQQMMMNLMSNVIKK